MSHPTIRERIVSAAETIPVGQEFAIDEILQTLGGKGPTKGQVIYHLRACGMAKKVRPGVWVREGEE